MLAAAPEEIELWKAVAANRAFLVIRVLRGLTAQHSRLGNSTGYSEWHHFVCESCYLLFMAQRTAFSCTGRTH